MLNLNLYSEPKESGNPRYLWYVTCPVIDGKRRKKYFKTWEEAKLFSENQNKLAQEVGIRAAELSVNARQSYITAEALLATYNISVLDAVREYKKAQETLSPYGVSLSDALQEYADARRKLLPYQSGLPEVVEHFQRWNVIKETSVTLQRAYDLYMDDLFAKSANDKRRRIADQRSRLTRFVGEIGPEYVVGLVTSELCNKWLNELTIIKQTKQDTDNHPNRCAKKVDTGKRVSPTTRNSYRLALSSFFSFCEMAGYIENNPIKKVRTSKVVSKEISYYDIATAQRMLNATKPGSDIRLYIAIGLFAGLRSSEICRLVYSDIRLDEGAIVLLAKNTKTDKKRLVKMSANLKAWLAPYALKIAKRANSKIIGSNFRKRLYTYRKTNKIDWLANGLRHSYGTYYYALTSNIYDTAKQMGNSPHMVEDHYANQLVTQEKAEKFFSILPEKPEGVILQFDDIIDKHVGNS